MKLSAVPRAGKLPAFQGGGCMAETFRPAMGKAPEIRAESAESPRLKKWQAML